MTIDKKIENWEEIEYARICIKLPIGNSMTMRKEEENEYIINQRGRLSVDSIDGDYENEVNQLSSEVSFFKPNMRNSDHQQQTRKV